MNDPRRTEERLRYHLDSNQVMRERLCLAIMPLIGPYTRERPRRPKGGPDGGRDIEALYEGNVVTWGAVGFRNGGGNDDQARSEASSKFQSDLERALVENPTLQVFVFFTNVDLTPSIIEQLKEMAVVRGVPVVDIVDLERLRHVLDSPEGLIARLQYLDIPMSTTEQIALVNKFGNQLQNAVLARFDRVELTLLQMERFLAFQKPLYRLDIYIELEGKHCSSELGNEAVLLRIGGLEDLNKTVVCLISNHAEHDSSDTQLVARTYIWLDEKKDKQIAIPPSLGRSASVMTAYCELSLTTGGHRVRIADLTTITLTAFITESLFPLIKCIMIDANGYELFKYPISMDSKRTVSSVEIPDNIAIEISDQTWFESVSMRRELLFEPPVQSGRLLPLQRI